MSGLRLVPVIATDAMMDAGVEAARKALPAIDGTVGYVQTRLIYDSMVGAAPITPMAEDDREALARIIDPEAWDTYDYNIKCAVDRERWNNAEGRRQAPGFRRAADESVKSSLDRADQAVLLLEGWSRR